MSTSNRPLSPHIQVYRPQMTSMLSFIHRLTGLILALGLVVFVYWLYALATNPGAADQFRTWMLSVPGQIVIYLWILAFFYHFCNGIRHLLWDVGKGFTIPQVYRSGYLVLALSVALTLMTYLLA